MWTNRNTLGLSGWHVINATGHQCQLEGALYTASARPSGALIEIVLTGQPGEISGFYGSAPGVNVGSPQVAGNGTVQKLEFQSAPLEAFSRYPVWLYLQADRTVSREDCDKWSKNIRPSVQ